jgi:hypothetical protein
MSGFEFMSFFYKRDIFELVRICFIVFNFTFQIYFVYRITTWYNVIRSHIFFLCV